MALQGRGAYNTKGASHTSKIEVCDAPSDVCWRPQADLNAVDGVKGRDCHFDRLYPTFTKLYISYNYFIFLLPKSRRLRLDFMPFVGHSVGQMKTAISAVINGLKLILSRICGAEHTKRG